MSRLFRLSKTPKSTKTDSRSDWLTPLHDVVQMVQSAGDLSAFPYVSQAAGVVLAVLDVIQRVHQNKEDLKELADTIVGIIVVIRDEVVSSSSEESKFRTTCYTFIEYLIDLMQELNENAREGSTRWFMSYLKSQAIHDTIAKHRRRIEDLRLNFILGTTIDTRLHLREIHRRSCNTILPSDTDLSLSGQDLEFFTRADIELSEPMSSYSHIDTHNTIIIQYKAKVRGELKTVRCYQGRDSFELWKSDMQKLSNLWHPNVLQPFGAHHSLHQHALIFHGDYRTIENHIEDLIPIEKMQFRYRMIQEYQEAWAYLALWFPHCDNSNINVTGLLIAGCLCDSEGREYSFETFVSSRGKICISLSTGRNPDRHLNDSSDSFYPNPMPRISKALMEPVGKLRSRTSLGPSLKSMISGYYTMIDIMRPSPTWAVVHYRPVAIGDLWIDVPSSQCHTEDSYRGVSPGRLVINPPLPFNQIRSRWECWPGYSSFGILCHFSDEWSRFTLTNHKLAGSLADSSHNPFPEFVYASTDFIGLDPLALNTPWLSRAPRIISDLRHTLGPRHSKRSANPLIVTDVCATMKLSTQFSGAPDSVYLFTRNLVIGEDGVVNAPDYFWSLDPLGREHLDKDIISKLDIPDPLLELQTYSKQYPPETYDALHALYDACGLDSNNDAIARLLDCPTTIEYAPHLYSKTPRNSVRELLTAECRCSSDTEWNCISLHIPTSMSKLSNLDDVYIVRHCRDGRTVQ